MAISYINARTSASSITSTDSTSSKSSKLGNERFQISQSIKKIENSIAELTSSHTATAKSLSKNLSMLKNVDSIVDKFGKDASVRLKGNTLKYGEPSGFMAKMFHGSRYQMERDAAVQKFNGKGSEVTASTVSSILNEKISNANNKLDTLELGIKDLQSQISGLNAKFYSVSNKISNNARVESESKKVDEKTKEQREIFSSIYQTNAGAKALNAEARHLFGNGSQGSYLSSSKVIEEYQEAHTSGIFYKGNAELKSTIEAYCGDISGLAKMSAKALYTPTEKNITTYRGQGMTDNGIKKLISQFRTDKESNSPTSYKLGQFFSTSTDNEVARDFAERSKDDVQVMFRLKGNSGHSLFVRGGLTFKNKESEKLYSPLANVKVVNIEKTGPGAYQIDMIEVPRSKEAKLLPY